MTKLIDGWRDRRALRPPAKLLPAYVAFNGMKDGRADLLDALKNVRAFCRGELTDHESTTVADLLRAAEWLVYGKP